MNTKIFDQLQNILTNGKNLTDKVIAKYILENLYEVTELSTIDLANKCFVSPAGIIRFCQKIGLSGISELKYDIKLLLSNIHLEGYQFNANAELKNKHQDFLESYLKIKIQSSELIHEDFLKKDWTILIDKIINAKTIFIFSFNLAYNNSRNFAQRLRWINKNVIHENDINSIKSYIPLIDENDVVIYISLSGESEFILKINELIGEKCYSFAIIGKQGKLSDNCSDFFLIKSQESTIWDVFSIRAQSCIQFLDYLYIIIVNKYF